MTTTQAPTKFNKMPRLTSEDSLKSDSLTSPVNAESPEQASEAIERKQEIMSDP